MVNVSPDWRRGGSTIRPTIRSWLHETTRGFTSCRESRFFQREGAGASDPNEAPQPLGANLAGFVGRCP